MPRESDGAENILNSNEIAAVIYCTLRISPTTSSVCSMTHHVVLLRYSYVNW